MDHELVCQSCAAVHPPGAYPTGCPDCREQADTGRLEVTYDTEAIPDAAIPETTRAVPGIESMWRYRDLLPVLADTPVTLQEGGTPIVEPDRFAADLPVSVVFKNEMGNPTWSYKDRLNSVLITNAHALGETRIAVSSTGNHGASSAAYASRAGIDDVIVLIPDETEAPLRAQIRAYGAAVVVTEYAARGGLLAQLVERGWYPTVNVTDPYTGLPYGIEGYKTIAFELIEQLAGVPDVVVTPIGAGDGLYGIWKGFRELHALDAINSAPRMVGVQPAERPSVVDAIETGADEVDRVSGPMPITTSVSGASAGSHTLRAIRESGGTALAVARQQVEAAVTEVAREGLLLEPASALTPAAVVPMVREGIVGSGESIVCIASGSGVKWPDRISAIVGQAPRIEPTLSALANAVDTPIDAGE